jgi:beta-lactam-binding protein with PASTA domain
MKKNSISVIKKLWDNLLIRNIFLSVISVIFLLVFSSIFLDTYTRHGKFAPVPDFTGKTLDSVSVIAANHSLRIEIIDSVFRTDMPRGSVLFQNPEHPMPVKKNRKIFLTVNSLSPRKESVPNVKEISLRLAKTNLGIKGFRVGKLEYSYDHPYTNEVFKQVYKGREIEPGILLPVGEYIDLKIGLSPDSLAFETFTVPNVTGYTKQAVEDIIIENSLNYILYFDKKGVKTITDSLNCVAYKQDPPAGAAAHYGNNVKVWLKLPEKSKK